MASRTVTGDRARIGAPTLRRDRWWLSPLVTVAVLGSLDEEDAGVLRRVRHHTGAALAFSLAVDGWSAVHLAPEQRRPSGVPLLLQHGWKAVDLAIGDSVATRWRQLGTRGGAGTSGSTSAAASVEATR